MTLTRRTTRSRRARRSSVTFSRMPGAKASPMTTKSKTFQPSLKKSCGRLPKAAIRIASSTTKIAEEDVVEGRDQRVDARAELVGAEPERDRVGDDDAEDERLKAPGVGDLATGRGHLARHPSSFGAA